VVTGSFFLVERKKIEDCGIHSNSETSRNFCRCNPGYSSNPPGSGATIPVCVECAANTYKVGSNQNPCLACGTFMQSQSASALQSQCLCNQGYHFTSSFASCVACGAGTYKDSVQNNGPSDCTSCPDDSFSPSISTHLSNCTCNAGFTRSQGTAACDACGKGTFKADQGDSPCQDCGVGTYDPNLNATKCFDCYDNSASPAGSDA